MMVDAGLAVKICGITTPEVMQAAIAGGARWVGLVFYPPSPRDIAIDTASLLARQVPTGVRVTGLFVEPSDEELERAMTSVALDALQFHGDESPARVREIAGLFGAGKQIIKAIPVRDASDIERARDWQGVADIILFDAKPPKGVAALPGGNALSFDWSLMQGVDIGLPWMLAGGLNAGNLAEAVATSGARAVDVSSGVEDRPGHKTPEKVGEFLAGARRITPA